MHQYTTKRIVDPRVDAVRVTRYTCKVCGYVRRQYRDGVGSGRLSLAMVQVCRVLRDFGLSYHNLWSVLSGLGCRVSIGTLHRAVGGSPDTLIDHLHLRPGPIRHLAGPDGDVSFGWDTPGDIRHLVIEIAPGPQAGVLHGRLAWAIVHTENGTNAITPPAGDLDLVTRPDGSAP